MSNGWAWLHLKLRVDCGNLCWMTLHLLEAFQNQDFLPDSALGSNMGVAYHWNYCSHAHVLPWEVCEIVVIAFDMWMVTREMGQWAWLLLRRGWTPNHPPRPLTYDGSNLGVGPFLILIVVSLKTDNRKGSILNHCCQVISVVILNPCHAHLDQGGGGHRV